MNHKRYEIESMANILRVIETLILGAFLGFIPLVFCLLTTMVIASALFGRRALGPWTLWSLVAGIIINVLFLKKWIRNAYKMSNKTLGIIYLFYSIVALGMCMGIPIGNFMLCIAAGIYAARRMQLSGTDRKTSRLYFKKTAAFCATVIALMCCLITLWAIAGQMIGSKFQTPWFSFTFTVPVFAAVVLTGGTLIVLLQYLLTSSVAKLTFKLLPEIHSS